jgi:hypothetical protein
MLGIISMLFGAGFALHQEMQNCKLIHPRMTDRQAFELSIRPQGCVRKSK